eukprot:5914104-Pyramimonas_sp.AAC.1
MVQYTPPSNVPPHIPYKHSFLTAEVPPLERRAPRGPGIHERIPLGKKELPTIEIRRPLVGL